MKFAFGVYPQRDTRFAGQPVLGKNGLPFPTPGHRLCRSRGRAVVTISDFGPELDAPDAPISRYGASFLSWHRSGYVLGIGSTPEAALADLASQCGTDVETIRVYCDVQI